MKVTDFINGKVEYDVDGQYFFVHSQKGRTYMIAELRGYGSLQNLFNKNGEIKGYELDYFHDEVGRWIADAINEKIQKENENRN